MPGLVGRYILADIPYGRLFTFDPLAALPGGQAALTELMLTQNGQPFDLNAAFGYPNPWNDGNRVDARLQETADGELLLALKSTGEVYRLVQDVPEPASLTLLGAALLALLARRARPYGASSL